jgi:uncharacterized protein YjiK
MKKISIPLSVILFAACIFSSDQSVLSFYKFSERHANSILLPGVLKEISGIAVSDERVFAEEDEHGIIYQVDLQTGKVIKSFSLGDNIINEDFEDITVIQNKFYLATSNGYIYEFAEGKENEKVGYKKYYTGLTDQNNIEGMCFDPETNSLLLACKDYPGKGYDGYRTVYSFSLNNYKLNGKPRFVLPVDYITSKLDIKNFRPSGIARHPKFGTFFIISAHSKAIIEVSKDDKIINLFKLSKKVHNQPEGIAIMSDNTLLISDEGKEYGQLTKYSFNN